MENALAGVAGAPWDEPNVEPSTALDLQGGETDDNNALPEFITKGSRGSLIAQIPWVSKDGKKSDTASRTATLADFTAIARKLSITRKEARQLAIDTFEVWHGDGNTGYDNPAGNFIKDCVARYRAQNAADDNQPTVTAEILARWKADDAAMNIDPYMPDPSEPEAMREAAHGTKH